MIVGRRRPPARLATVASIILALCMPASASANHAFGGLWHMSDLNLGHAERHVHFDDRTDSTWPVGAAADSWNNSSKLYVTRLGCPGTFEYCPPVHQVNNNNYKGLAVLTPNAAGTHITRDQDKTYINLSNITPSSQRRFVACQEEGHILGLDHRASQVNSCMWDGSPFYSLPDGHDFSALFNVYDHNDP